MAAEDDRIDIVLNVEVEKSQLKVTKLKLEIDKLTASRDKAKKMTKEHHLEADKLAVAQKELMIAEKQLTKAVSDQTYAEQNSTIAIQKQIKVLHAENSQLNKNSAQYAQNAARINSLSKSMTMNSAASGAATSSVMELGRVISDAPYGMRGMANNLSQFTSLMFYATTAAGSFKLALQQMFKAMMGPLGIVLAITTVISILDGLSSSSSKATKSMKNFTDQMVDSSAKIEIMSAKLDSYLSVLLNGDKASTEYSESLKALSKMGLDPAAMSVDQLTNAISKLKDEQSELIVLNDKLELNEQAVSDANVMLEDIRQKEAAIRVEMGKKNDIINDKESNKTQIKQAKSRNSILQSELDENLALNKEYDEKRLKAIEEYQTTYERILKIDSGGKDSTTGTDKDPKDKVSNTFEGKVVDFTSENKKIFQKNAKQLQDSEEVKLRILQKAEREELQMKRNAWSKKEALRLSKFKKKQQAIVDDETQSDKTREDAAQSIIDAQASFDNAEIESKIAHYATLEEMEKTHGDEMRILQKSDAQKKMDLLSKLDDQEKELSEYKQTWAGLVRVEDKEAKIKDSEEEIDRLANLQSMEKKNSLAWLMFQRRINEEEIKIKKTQEQIDKEVTEAKIFMINSVMNATTSLFATMKNNSEKGSKEEKKFAMLEIYAGAAKGLMNGVLIAGEAAKQGGPAAPFIYAGVLASQFASIYGAVTQAKNVLNGGSPAGGGTKAETPEFAPNFNVVGNSNQNQLAQSIQDQTNGPTRAYVVYEDIAEAGATSEQSIESSGI